MSAACALKLPEKKTLHASERDTERVEPARAEYKVNSSGIALARYEFIDESGFNIAMTPLYGRAKPGERVVESEGLKRYWRSVRPNLAAGWEYFDG